MSETTQQKVSSIEKVQKRDGSFVAFDIQKITAAIFAAAQSVGGTDQQLAQKLAHQVLAQLALQFKEGTPTVEQIQDAVESTLIEEGHAQTAKSFILYRAKRTAQRSTEPTEQVDVSIEALNAMFEHKGKTAERIGYDLLAVYKELLFMLKAEQKSGALPMHPTNNYLGEQSMGSNELALRIYKEKYFLKSLDNCLIEKRPEDTFARLAAFTAAVETTSEKQRSWAKTFYNALYAGKFLPGGRVIAGAGDLFRLRTLANCFVSLIQEDSIESIYQAAYEAARTYSYGGGVGIDISGLRPKNAVVHNSATSSTGSVSFMDIYSLTTGIIGQEGRKGAMMITIDVKHPDVLEFIDVKRIPNWVTNQITDYCRWSEKFDEQQLSLVEKYVMENTQVKFANISLKVSDEFLQAVSEQKRFSVDTLLVYDKDPTVDSKRAAFTKKRHYSHSMPSKPIDKYELLGDFSSLDEANNFLTQYGVTLTAEQFKERDIFGDCLLTNGDKEFAVHYAGDFMLYYHSTTAGEYKTLCKASDIWNKFVESNYRTAEPGLIFWSNMSKYSPSNYAGRPIASTNPCAEVPLEDGGACNLGSLNLSLFVKNSYTEQAELDWRDLAQTTQVLIRFLDNVVSWNERLNALEKQRKSATETRRLGLGVMGIADMLNQLGIAYDSEEGMGIIEKVAQVIANAAYVSSAELAEEKGPSPIFNYEEYSRGPFFKEALNESTQELIRQKGLRNIAMLAIAPTGTLSNTVLGYKKDEKHYMGVSSGIEPIFSLSYTRRTESFTGKKIFKVFHPTVQAYLDEKGLTVKANNVEKLEEVLPEYFFRTAHHLDPVIRVKIQGIFQKFVDHSISSTVNLAEDVSPEVISDIYLDAWKHGLKGITIYRDGSRYPILSVEGKKTIFQAFKDKEFTFMLDGEQQTHKGDAVLLAPSGKLVTAFEAARDNIFPVTVLPERFEEAMQISTVEKSVKHEATEPVHEEVVVENEELIIDDSTEEEVTTEAFVGGEQVATLIADNQPLSKCSECGHSSLKMENGCYTCIRTECGFSKCDI